MEPLAPGDPQPVRPAGTSPVAGPGAQGQGPVRIAPPRPAAPRHGEYGTLTIRVQPADAEILVDGEHWDGSSGDARVVVQLAPGSHRVEVRKNGYSPFSTDVTVRSGESAPLNVSLARPR